MSGVNNPNDYNGADLIVVCGVFLPLTFISVLLRLYTKIFITKAFSLDDWLMLISQVVFTISCSLTLAGVQNGTGRHNKTLPQRNEINALMFQALATITYVINMMFIKLSIGVFLLRIAVKRRYIWILRISMAVVTIWSLVIIFYQFFQCQPVAFQWDYTLNGKCPPQEQFVAAALSVSIMTIVSDWLYSLLPIFMIWNVQMSLQKKITVGFVLGLGVFASVATLIRLKYLAELADLSDILYVATDATIWTLIEPGIAIIAAALVTIRPLLYKLQVAGFSSKNTSNYALSNYGQGRGLSLRNHPPIADWQKDPFAQNTRVATNSGKDRGITEPGSKANAVVRDAPSGDNSSEEYIMDGIVRTLDVSVTRDDQGRSYRQGIAR